MNHIRPQRATRAAGQIRRAGLAALALGLLSATMTTTSYADEGVDAPDAPASDAVRVQHLSTPTSNTYRQSDGTYELIAYTKPINYMDDNGDWQAIDNQLMPAAGEAYAVENAANDYTARIPSDASETPVRFAVNGAWVTMQMHGVDAAPVVDAAEATFTDVRKADEVTYVATSEGLKENIVLNGVPVDSVKYTYTLDASSGLSPVLTDAGAIDFVDAGGDVAVTVPVGNMIDSASDPAYSEAVEYALVDGQDGAWTLTVTPSMDWLTDASRVYPVTIDPSLMQPPVIRDCWINQELPTTKACGNTAIAAYLRTGLSDNSFKRRSLLDFDISMIPAGSYVSDASVNLYLDPLAGQSASNPTADYAFFSAGKAFDSNATWNSAGASGTWTGGNPGTTAYGTKSLTGGTEGWKKFTQMQGLVQGWVDGTITKNGVVLKQVSETAKNVLWFYSSSTATTNDDKRPYLSATYTIPFTQAELAAADAVASNVYTQAQLDTVLANPDLAAITPNWNTSSWSVTDTTGSLIDMTATAGGDVETNSVLAGETAPASETTVAKNDCVAGRTKIGLTAWVYVDGWGTGDLPIMEYDSLSGVCIDEPNNKVTKVRYFYDDFEAFGAGGIYVKQGELINKRKIGVGTDELLLYVKRQFEICMPVIGCYANPKPWIKTWYFGDGSYKVTNDDGI